MCIGLVRGRKRWRGGSSAAAVISAGKRREEHGTDKSKHTRGGRGGTHA